MDAKRFSRTLPCACGYLRKQAPGDERLRWGVVGCPLPAATILFTRCCGPPRLRHNKDAHVHHGGQIVQVSCVKDMRSRIRPRHASGCRSPRFPNPMSLQAIGGLLLCVLTPDRSSDRLLSETSVGLVRVFQRGRCTASGRIRVDQTT